MKIFHLIVIFAVSVGLLEFCRSESISIDISQNNQYQDYYRNLVKRQNSKLIEEHNRNKSNQYQLKENKFLSLTNEEFHAMYTMDIRIDEQRPTIIGVNFAQQIQQDTLSKGVSSNTTTIYQQQQSPSINIDLSDHVSPVKDQGKCNSCYAHSVLATVETMLHFKENKFYDLSEQQIADCTLNWTPTGVGSANNQGCVGGWGWKTSSYLVTYGVTYEKYYPYVSGKTLKLGRCNEYMISTKRFRIQDYEYFYNKENPESQCYILNDRLAQNKTIAVSIWAPKGIDFQFYGSQTPGIDIYNKCGPYKDVNHELQLVGSTDKYWKLKNSYGPDWGQKGFLYLDKSKGLNCLNICLDFSIPTQLSV